MTPEQQTKVRIAIAEFCGWPKDHPELGRMYTPHGDPLLDLNAMHEAEKALTPNQLYDYAAKLSIICTPESDHRGVTLVIFRATALQRAEALYRTIKGEAP